MRRDRVNDLLNRVNQKSRKQWSLQDIQSLAKGYKKEDLKDDRTLTQLIEKVARAAGVRLTDEKMNKIREKVSKFNLF